METSTHSCAYHLRPNVWRRLVDFGSGSGAIVLSLLHSFPSAEAVAVDPKEAARQHVLPEVFGIIIPTDELIFFRGVETTNQHIGYMYIE